MWFVENDTLENGVTRGTRRAQELKEDLLEKASRRFQVKIDERELSARRA
jgi:hypothetical protein